MQNPLVFFLLIVCHWAIASDLEPRAQARRIDSLMIKYEANYEQVNQEADELYELLNTKYTTKEYLDIKIGVMLQKSILLSLKGADHKALELALKALDIAEKHQLPKQAFNSCWTIALMYEIGADYPHCRKYLNQAQSIYQTHHLDSVYSVYCIRLSSYYLFVQKPDSALLFAYKALDYAQKYDNEREIRDAHLLLGALLSKTNYPQAIKHKSLAAQNFIAINDYSSAAIQYSVAASILLKHKQIEAAFKYSDSAIALLKTTGVHINGEVFKIRSKLFEATGNIDSAYYNFLKYHDEYVIFHNKMESAKIKQVSEQYQNDKKEIIINDKNQQLTLIIIFLTIIIIAAILLYLSKRKISRQNKIIHQQLGELTKTLEQKQVLLAELQHRVKNNLQHVISILEIQKESVNFNNIDELIRGNQNRIHSMALLHKKLNVAEHVNDVDLKKYITELAELVKDSYDNHHKKISLHIQCSIETTTIEKALPIGLIIVELVSNSMKHAFKKRNIGIINIELSKNRATAQNNLYYADNGEGFDFNKTGTKGLGMEIIKGLIDQLDGTVESNYNNGFELTVYFQ